MRSNYADHIPCFHASCMQSNSHLVRNVLQIDGVVFPKSDHCNIEILTWKPWNCANLNQPNEYLILAQGKESV